MQAILIRKLQAYISENNPDLLLTLQEENRLRDYLYDNVGSVDGLINQLLSDNQPPFVIEEGCMQELIRPLKPSRFQYLKNILEEEFPAAYERFMQHGVLNTEVINLVRLCDVVFDEANFSEENEDNRHLRYTIMGAVHEHLNKE